MSILSRTDTVRRNIKSPSCKVLGLWIVKENDQGIMLRTNEIVDV